MKSLDHLENLQIITVQIIEESEALFAPLSEEILNTNLTVNQWSIAQCLHHLNKFANFYNNQFKNALNKVQKETVNDNLEEIKYSWLGKKFLKYLELDENELPKKKRKALKKSYQVNSDFTKKEVELFLENQKEIWALLETAKEKPKLRFIKIQTMFPLLKLKALDMFSVQVYHNYRHFVQAKRVLEKIKIQSN